MLCYYKGSINKEALLQSMSSIIMRLAVPAICFAAALVLRNQLLSMEPGNSTEDLIFLLLQLP